MLNQLLNSHSSCFQHVFGTVGSIPNHTSCIRKARFPNIQFTESSHSLSRLAQLELSRQGHLAVLVSYVLYSGGGGDSTSPDLLCHLNQMIQSRRTESLECDHPSADSRRTSTMVAELHIRWNRFGIRKDWTDHLEDCLCASSLLCPSAPE